MIEVGGWGRCRKKCPFTYILQFLSSHWFTPVFPYPLSSTYPVHEGLISEDHLFLETAVGCFWVHLHVLLKLSPYMLDI